MSVTFQNDINDPEKFVITMELVPKAESTGRSIDSVLGLAQEAFEDGRLSAVTITDNPGAVVHSDLLKNIKKEWEVDKRKGYFAAIERTAMKWTKEAEEAVKRIPFFVRKKVKSRVEKEAMASGKNVVSIIEVKTTQARYLSNMESEIKGFRVETCFGAGGCPNRTIETENLISRIEQIFESENLLGFLKTQVKEPLKFHHEFRVTIADCPNACSQPQIKDIGIIGATLPKLSDMPCTLCEACALKCKENPITLDQDIKKPIIDFESCVACGQCVSTCPTGTLVAEKKGFRVQIGGKLGRHPQLALELLGIFNEDEVLHIVTKCIALYKKFSKNGQRFGSIINRFDLNELTK
jgi:dissimilatory sulfite reductase (desulfoviridin) alpha/beta subunit